jgi:hypothetical protein
VRTNPVTGWKSIFPIGLHVQQINDVTQEESTKLLDWFQDLLLRNHDLQVRFKWNNENDFGRYPIYCCLFTAIGDRSRLMLTGT